MKYNYLSYCFRLHTETYKKLKKAKKKSGVSWNIFILDLLNRKLYLRTKKVISKTIHKFKCNPLTVKRKIKLLILVNLYVLLRYKIDQNIKS